MERQLRALETSEGRNRYKISLPVDFIHELSTSTSVQEVLDTVARWLYDIFEAERASVTLVEDDENLKIYAISGDSAIPRGFSVPIRGTFVGRVFLTVNYRSVMIYPHPPSLTVKYCGRLALQPAWMRLCSVPTNA